MANPVEASAQERELHVSPEVATGTQTSAPGARLWRDRNFTIFWGGQTLSVLGDTFALIAMPLLVLQATGSVALMGLVTAAYGVGQLISGVFSGPIVDRVDRRRLMILCDIIRIVLYATIPLGWWLAGPQLWLIFVVVGLGAMFGMLFQVAYITAVANLVDRDQITDANSRLEGTFAIAYVLGPMLAGFISARFQPAAAVGIDACSFAVSALTLSAIRLRRAAAARPTTRERPLAEMLAGVRFLLHQPVLRAVTVLLSTFMVLVAAGNDLFIYRLKHDLGQGDNAVGIVFGLASVGAILSAALAPYLRRRFGFGPCWLGGILLDGVLIAAIGIAPGVAIIAPLAMGFTFANTLSGINSMSLRQEITPDHLLGRVTAAFWTLNQALGPIGAALTTAIAAGAGTSAVLLAMGAGGIVLAAIGVFTPARARWPERSATLYSTKVDPHLT